VGTDQVRSEYIRLRFSLSLETSLSISINTPKILGQLWTIANSQLPGRAALHRFCGPSLATMLHGFALMNVSRPESSIISGELDEHRWIALFNGQASKKYTPIQIIFLAAFGVVIIGIPDYLLGTEISLSIFYFIPVGIASWYAGRFAGGSMSLFSTLPIFVGEWSAGFFFRHP